MLETMQETVFDENGAAVGSICRKPPGHWTAYLSVSDGDRVVGQYPDPATAKAAVLAADGVAVVDDVCNTFAELGVEFG